jgi:formamidopyrimidine-DNA glycosylase
VPELPEVQAIVDLLAERAVGRAVVRVDVVAVNVLKTFDPPVSALAGLLVEGIARRGKFVDLDVGGLHLVMHLARAGWLRWRDELPAAAPKPGRGPLALRVHLDGGGGFDLTEQGTRKGLSVSVVRDPAQVSGVARLGPDPLDPTFTVEVLAGLLAGSRAQVKGLLRDQSVVGGIGNAYSDDILQAARISPFKPASNLTPDEVATLWSAIQDVLRGAVERSRGLATSDLKAEKRAGMRVHGRTGQPCPDCKDTVREVSFADSSLQYCATCQTGGKPLADRRLSRLLK